MSLYGMMRTGVSGMAAQSNRLGTVADNIANSGTTGYKRAYTEFSSLILPGESGSYSSGAIKTTVRTAISQQGLLQFSSSTTDLAVQGDGFFVVENQAGQQFLSRGGSFVPDAQGRLVNAAGHFLVGTRATEGNINGANLDVYSIYPSGLSAEASTQGTLNSNLPSTAEIGQSFDRSIVIYNGLGEELTVQVSFTKTATNEWSVVTDPAANGPVTLQFDPATGQLSETSASSLDIQISVTPPQPFTLSFAGTTQLAADYQTSPAIVDGAGPGSYEEIRIDGRGMVTAINQNGSVVPLFQIPLATVASPDRLNVLPGNIFQVSSGSGQITYGTGTSSKFGEIVSGAVEGSNVDIAEELTNMIESQRNYTANSKVFQTGADLLDVLVNLKR